VVYYNARDSEKEAWFNYGFYKFTYPFIEVAYMFFTLVPFFLLNKSKKYLKLNERDKKDIFLRKLTDEDSPTLYHILFFILDRLDVAVCFVIFFSGVNKIDFYHIALIFFLVAFTLAPNCFKRNFIILLIYANFFVFEKYIYTLIQDYIDPNGFFVNFAEVVGLSSEYLKENSKSNLFLNNRFRIFQIHPKVLAVAVGDYCVRLVPGIQPAR